MQQYTNKTLSKRLSKLGVKSQSQYWHMYHLNSLDKKQIVAPLNNFNKEVCKNFYPVYILSDFVGTHKEAKENAKKITNGNPLLVVKLRYQLIDSKDWREELKLWLK